MSTDTIDRPTSTELRAQLTEQGDKLRDLRNKPQDQRDDKYADELRATVRTVEALDAEFDAVQKLEDHAVRQVAWDAAVALAKANEGRGPDAALTDLARQAPRSIAERATDRDEYRAWAESNSGGLMPQFHEERGSFRNEVRALIDGTLTGSGNGGVLVPVGQPIPPTPRQMKLVVRDLIPTYETNLPVVPYVREYTPDTNETGASSVAEAGLKPEATTQFESVNCIVEKLAVWVPVTMEVLSDAPTLRAYIDNRLRYMIAFREQAEILKGNGISPDLVGIYTVSGTQTQTATNNDVPGTVADAIAKVELKDGQADGIVMNPGDFWASVSERRSTTFDGDAVGTAPFGAPPPTLWGLSVVRTRALSTLECVVGDWAQGAGIFDRMTITVRQSDSHDTFFIYNKVALLAEERVGVAWFRPDLFVLTTLDITA